MNKFIPLLGGIVFSTVAFADPSPVEVNKYVTEGYAAYTEAEGRAETSGNPGNVRSTIKSPQKVITAADRAAAQAAALSDARSKANEFCHFAPKGYNKALNALNYSVLLMTDDGVGYRIFLAHNCETND